MLTPLHIPAKCSFIFIRSQARYRVPTRSVDLIITELLVLPLGICTLFHRGSCFHRPTFVQFFALRSPTWFFADVCSVLCLSLLDLFLGSSPSSSVQLEHRSSLSDSTHACKRKNFFIPVVCPALFAGNRAFHLSASNYCSFWCFSG
jgi:hypothetical protein